jgi:hypothetical protein
LEPNDNDNDDNDDAIMMMMMIMHYNVILIRLEPTFSSKIICASFERSDYRRREALPYPAAAAKGAAQGAND